MKNRIHSDVNSELAGMIDHILMAPSLTEKETISGCYLARYYQVASVCVKPCYIRQAVTSLQDTNVKVSTIIGFPFGIQSTSVKVAEAKRALTEGSNELEMVINIGYLLDENEALFSQDIQEICGLAHLNGASIKVVLETGYLDNPQIAKAARLAVDNGADWVATTTGFTFQERHFEHVSLIQKACDQGVKIKSSLVDCSLSDFLTLREMGCSRIGTRSTKDLFDAE